VGVFAISIVQKQARLVGTWLQEPSREALLATYTLAQRELERCKQAVEFVALGNSDLNASAASASGLRMIRTLPVFMLSKHGSPIDLPGELQFADYDGFFLSGRKPEFET
jgi:hypothetical protein